MPELPDLEVFRETILKKVKGNKIISVGTNAIKKLSPQLLSEYSKVSNNSFITKIERRAKYLIFTVSKQIQPKPNDPLIMVHLMLNGKFVYGIFEKEPNKTDIFWFEFEDKKQLRITDKTRWAKLELITDGDKSKSKFLKMLGPEPFDLSFNSFKLILKKGRLGRIKPLLMDQKKLAGVGNAYTDESLWLSGIHPNRTASLLNDNEIRTLYKSLILKLNEGIENNKKDVKDSLDESKREWMSVYRQKGKPCPRCFTQIEMLKVNQRDTFICPNCQKEK